MTPLTVVLVVVPLTVFTFMYSLNGGGESPCSIYLYTEEAYLFLNDTDADMRMLSYQASLGTFYKVILLSAAAKTRWPH